ncbi:MAG: SdrD B-like domain-containing protein, partial [Flavobacteriaceae bacterium]
MIFVLLCSLMPSKDTTYSLEDASENPTESMGMAYDAMAFEDEEDPGPCVPNEPVTITSDLEANTTVSEILNGAFCIPEDVCDIRDVSYKFTFKDDSDPNAFTRHTGGYGGWQRIRSETRGCATAHEYLRERTVTNVYTNAAESVQLNIADENLTGRTQYFNSIHNGSRVKTNHYYSETRTCWYWFQQIRYADCFYEYDQHKNQYNGYNGRFTLEGTLTAEEVQEFLETSKLPFELNPTGDLILESAELTYTPTDCDANQDGICENAPECSEGPDSDNDGVSDVCDICEGHDDNLDSDNDLVPDGCDVCAEGDDNIDTDGDGIADACDICQHGDDNADNDGDSIPDGCDLDDDNDGILDVDESICTVDRVTTPENLTWHGRAASNISTADGTTLTVSGAAWANAYSDQSFDLPLTIQGTVTAAVHGMIGILPVNGTETTGWNDRGYKFQFNGSNGMYVRHGSSVSGWQAPSIVGTTFKLEIDADGKMKYIHNGAEVYTGTIPIGNYKLTISRGSFTVANFQILRTRTTTDPNECDTLDTDGDGTPNHLDPDSDGDGCPDAFEGDGDFTLEQIENGALTGDVDANGIPTIASGGQGIGSSQDDTVGCDVNAALGDTVFYDNDRDGIQDPGEDGVPNVTVTL